jgi:hypothetical protein
VIFFPASIISPHIKNSKRIYLCYCSFKTGLLLTGLWVCICNSQSLKKGKKQMPGTQLQAEKPNGKQGQCRS